MTCREPGCERPAEKRGLCSMHYQRLLRAGLGPLENDKRGGRQPGPEPARHRALLALFGGLRPFCRAVGVHSPVVYRWPEGAIPSERHAEILAGAARAGVDVDAVRAALGDGR